MIFSYLSQFFAFDWAIIVLNLKFPNFKCFKYVFEIVGIREITGNFSDTKKKFEHE